MRAFFSTAFLATLLVCTAWYTGHLQGRMDDQQRQATVRWIGDKLSFVVNTGDFTLPPEKFDAIQSAAGLNLVILDARSPEEIAVGKIPGSISAERYDWGGTQSKERVVVIYDTIGVRSALLTTRYNTAERRGKLWNLQGGILGWIHAGRPIEAAGHFVEEVHVFSGYFALAPKRYKMVW